MLVNKEVEFSTCNIVYYLFYCSREINFYLQAKLKYL